MKKLLAGIVIGLVIYRVWSHVTGPVPDNTARGQPAEYLAPRPEPGAVMAVEREDFRCDGRVHCAQMTSCDEARYFLDHCPGVKMDGEGDGVPCEAQWCGHH